MDCIHRCVFISSSFAPLDVELFMYLTFFQGEKLLSSMGMVSRNNRYSSLVEGGACTAASSMCLHF